ncbi:hypothetical protein SCHPADRAFT_907218 [Schizopora paradoxa]|uniref:Uncharacterized protein n=1 Tax=Schizopora paradoxa TaxID=27342 RepID=A0A0H2REQ8_9AGAM|nr:hypothetical protein SCHPADRAFT_907218 [Schizopora paradoxa]
MGLVQAFLAYPGVVYSFSFFIDAHLKTFIVRTGATVRPFRLRDDTASVQASRYRSINSKPGVEARCIHVVALDDPGDPAASSLSIRTH